jgi:hypothetical protein
MPSVLPRVNPCSKILAAGKAFSFQEMCSLLQEVNSNGNLIYFVEVKSVVRSGNFARNNN